MLYRLLVFVFLIQMFHSCSVTGTYYLVNSSDIPLNIRLELRTHSYSINEKLLKSGSFTGEKIKYDDFEKMSDLFHEYDTLTKSITFVIEPQSYVFIGYGSNGASDIDVIRIEQLQESLFINDKDYTKVDITSKGTGVITIDQDAIKDIPPLKGEYIFDIIFAEWGGKSLGDKAKVIIEGEHIKVIFFEGNISGLRKDDVIDEGIIMKHKSGKWIISKDINSINAEEIGDCTGGPAIIDFSSRKYEMC